jgi:hypothetical protein
MPGERHLDSQELCSAEKASSAWPLSWEVLRMGLLGALHLHLSKVAPDRRHHDMVGPHLLLEAPAGILPAG